MLELTAHGLYCPEGDFHIDPWEPVPRAVITHAHADHARPGSQQYLCAAPGAGVLERRMGQSVQGLPWGERLTLGSVRVSLHPAGHVLGSAQVRLQGPDGVWVVSGDYKRQADPTCAAFEPQRCDVFVSEATFGLPVYRWAPTQRVIDDVVAWWDRCAHQGRPAVLGCYAFGKAQRLLAELSTRTDRPVWVHGAIAAVNAHYTHASGLGSARYVGDAPSDQDWSGQLILATPGAMGSRWMRRFKDAQLGLASGWMRVRGNRRWKSFDVGFALSDHADWPGLLQTIDETEADTVLLTHGTTAALARHLVESRGLDARPLETPFAGEQDG